MNCKATSQYSDYIILITTTMWFQKFIIKISKSIMSVFCKSTIRHSIKTIESSYCHLEQLLYKHTAIHELSSWPFGGKVSSSGCVYDDSLWYQSRLDMHLWYNRELLKSSSSFALDTRDVALLWKRCHISPCFNLKSFTSFES